MLAALLVVLPSCDYLQQRFGLGKYSLKAAREWARQDSTRVADSIKKVMAVKKSFNATITDSLMSVEKTAPREKSAGAGYYIVAGSFANHENAGQAAAKYAAMGYKTALLSSTNPGGISIELVTVSSFSDKNEAAVFLKEFQSKVDPEAWIFSKK